MTEQRRGPGSNAASQRDRLLAQMRRGGWVTGKDFRAPTCDGGPEIANVTPRISELGKVHHIVSERGEDGFARYRLARGLDDVPIKQLLRDAREAVSEPEPPAPADAPNLFDAALFDAAYEMDQRPGLYDVDEEGF